MELKFEKHLFKPKWVDYAVPVGSIIMGLLLGAIFLLCAGVNPLEAYREMLHGAFGTMYAFSETVVKTIPLILIGLGVAVAFRMLLWNIGAEGQFYMGAIGATWVALSMGHLPAIKVLPLMLLAGFLFGGLWGLIPALLKAYGGANEIITTLMLNYVAINLCDYLVYGPWKDPEGKGFPLTKQFAEGACLPLLYKRIHVGVYLALIAIVLIYLIINKSKWGYEIRVTGENIKAANYAGINVIRNIVLVMILSGGMAGIAGMAEVLGLTHRLQHGFSPGYGYTAIIVAWLARLNPLAMTLVAFLFGALLVGGDQIQMSMNLPGSMTGIIQGTILFSVLGGEIFSQYRIKFRK
ncbi:MAG TPA: ABC transporter permease [Candidatus Eremiobacteraeota bacterium]|nr:ABC transporter permease [Candidatus Eremiobacteraeota bacterium]